MNAVHEVYLKIFGADGHPTELSLHHMCLRGLIIFAAGIVIVRVGDGRSLSQKTAFDALFIVLLGSMLSRAINGTAPFLLTLAGAFALMLIHRACAWGAHRSHQFGKLLKGRPKVLVREGKVDWDELGRNLVSKHDFEEDLRLEAQTEDVAKIRIARLERSGDISFVKKNES